MNFYKTIQMNKLISLSIILAYTFHLNAQINISDYWGDEYTYTPKSNVLTEDIDGDSILDSLYYDFEKESIRILLSGRNFDTLSIDFTPLDRCKLYLEKDVLTVQETYMRAFEIYSYCFDNKANDFRMTHFFNEAYGGATNNGSGTVAVDLLTGDILAEWYYYDCEIDSLLPIPQIEVNIPIHPAYLGDSISTSFPFDSIFFHYKYLDIMEERIKNIDVEKLLLEQNISIDIPENINQPVDSVFAGDEELLSNYLKPPFNSTSENSCQYENLIVQLHQSDGINVYLVLFDFNIDKPIYAAFSIDKKTSEVTHRHISGDAKIGAMVK